MDSPEVDFDPLDPDDFVAAIRDLAVLERAVLAPGAVGPAPGRARTGTVRAGTGASDVRRARLGPRARAAAWARELPWAFTVLAVAGLALALRLFHHSTNYDVFIDEITYSVIGQAVALGHGVTLYRSPFFLHPPLFFFLEAAVLDLFGGARDTPVNLILALRPINCGLGAIECGLLMVLVRAITTRRAAFVAGVFMACDPFLELWDGRVLLETLAMTLAVLGWIALERMARHEDAQPARGRAWTPGEWAWVVLGGVSFGGSLLTKETYAFVGVVPLAAMLLLGSPVRRRVSGTMLGLAVLCYAVYLGTVLNSGRLSAWYSQQIAGVARAVGTKQISGFNQKGHASFSSGVGASLGLYIITYLVIAAIGLAALAGMLRWWRAARSGRPLSRQRRLAIALGAGGVGYVTYSVMFGAFETQIFYMCIVAGLPVLATETIACVPSPASARRRLRRPLVVAGAVLITFALLYEVAVDVHVRAERDSDIPGLVAYVDHHVRYPALIDSTDGVTQFVLQGVRIDVTLTLPGLLRAKPDYVVVAQGLVDAGYVTLGPGFEQWLHAHARVVFEARGRENGAELSPVLLYRTTYATTSAGAATLNPGLLRRLEAAVTDAALKRRGSPTGTAPDGPARHPQADATASAAAVRPGPGLLRRLHAAVAHVALTGNGPRTDGPLSRLRRSRPAPATTATRARG